MTAFRWVALNSTSDLGALASILGDEYGPKKVAQRLEADLSDAVKGLLVELHYVDKDYRSTYYHFYAKQGRHYRDDCVRLHFFDASVSFEEAELRLSCPDSLTDHYFGYMVLRPTGIATVGRSVLSPDVRKGACRSIVVADHKAHVLGHRLLVKGFPSMDQHVDIAVCAHVACWSILRHYSERYSIYREHLTHDVTMMAQDFNPGGLVPSLGLTVANAERVFQQAGTFPLLVTRRPKDPDPEFFRQIGAYLESGFPLFASMRSREHAIAIVGHEWVPKRDWPSGGLKFSWDEVARLCVVDDNYLPYHSMPALGSGTPYSIDDVDAFIVPLPEKVFYSAEAVDRLCPAVHKHFHKLLGLPSADQLNVHS